MTYTRLNCGYVPLVDCAPLIIARELGFAAEERLDLCLIQQPSWSALRDMLALGHLDAAQMLAPMPIAMSLGMGGLPAKIDTLMVLSVNGTVFGASHALALRLGDIPFGDAPAILSRLSALDGPTLRIGVPFPFSMHRLLLKYWLNTAPGFKVETVTIPPPLMAAAVADGRIDAFWVGEPWGSMAVDQDVGALLMTGRDVWRFAPEKVLAARQDWVTDHPNLVRRLMRAVFHAARWLNRPQNRPLAIEILARSEHLNLPTDLIDPALTGELTVHRDKPKVRVDQFLNFHKGAAHFPWRSQAAWIAAQLGATGHDITHAKACFRSDLYRENLEHVGADLPGASEKVEGAMKFETAVASTRGHMILGPDAFFNGKTFDFPDES